MYPLNSRAVYAALSKITRPEISCIEHGQLTKFQKSPSKGRAGDIHTMASVQTPHATIVSMPSSGIYCPQILGID